MDVAISAKDYHTETVFPLLLLDCYILYVYVGSCDCAILPAEPVQYQHAVAQQEKRARTIINGMSAGLFKTLLRLATLSLHHCH